MGAVPRKPLFLVALVAAVVVVAPADAGTGEPLPDFVVVGITVDPTVPPPQYPMYATVEIRNDGGVCFGCQPIAIDFYKHRTTPPVRNTIGETQCLVLPPLPGATTSCTGSVTYFPTGDYSMWAQVDTYNYATESNEANNILGPQTVTVARPPELRVQSIQVTPASPLQHQPADVRW